MENKIYTAQTGLPDYAPQWLKDANISNYEIEIDSSGYVIWHRGTWYDGEWHGRTWKHGIWYDGYWYGGTWHGGIWHLGTWYDGEWHGGAWYGGAWYSGIWNDGIWYGGTWYSGIWNDGASVMLSKYQPTIKDNEIMVGCKTMTADAWEKWLDGEKVFRTLRNTPEFALIEAHIRATITYLRTLDKYKNGE